MKRTSSARLPLLAAVVAALVAVAPSPAEARQQRPLPPGAREALQNLSREEIQRRIRESGLSEAQIRDRMRQAGYDPGLADPYFEDIGAEGLAESGPADREFLDVLRTIGIDLTTLAADSLRFGPDSLRVPLDSLADSLAVEPDSAAPLEVFGLDVFRRRTNEFEASPTGPVGPGYVLGPGDELSLVLTGDVQLAYRLTVSREGLLVIPQVGQISVNGLTLGALEERLHDRLGQVYSGVRRGPEATTHFSVSLGRLRTVQVYVVGEVARPGAYRISSVGTLLEALYASGGPRETGSFRKVTVRRDGRVVGSFDLYGYLTSGETAGAIRLEEGDVVFVSPRGPQVALAGEVLRPALYEIVEGEGLPDVVGYAGGLKPSARTDVIRVDRVLPRSEREVGRDRAVLDVDLDALAEGRDAFALRGGDEIEVFPVLDQPRGWVEVRGAVFRPGRYQHEPNATVETLVERAGGALPDVLDPVVHVSSLDLTDGSRSLVRIPLAVAPSVPLREFDEVTLFGRDSLLAPDSVAVYGLVRRPARYPLSAGATPEDLILLAGGFAFGADPRRAEVTRVTTSSLDGGSVSRSWRVHLSEDLPYRGPASREELPPLDQNGAAQASTFVLQPEDEVYVRRIPEYRSPRRVEVAGEVETPGTYVLQRIGERVSSILGRAGGLSEQAFADGFRLIRDGVTVGVDLGRALERPGSPDDPIVEDGDRLVVPIHDPTVLVTGAVAFETRVVYRRGMELSDLLAEAGGTTREADKGRVSVEYANGSRRTVKRFLGWNYAEPDIRPGSTVHVPTATEREGVNFDAILSQVLAVTSVIATVVIATK